MYRQGRCCGRLSDARWQWCSRPQALPQNTNANRKWRLNCGRISSNTTLVAIWKKVQTRAENGAVVQDAWPVFPHLWSPHSMVVSCFSRTVMWKTFGPALTTVQSSTTPSEKRLEGWMRMSWVGQVNSWGLVNSVNLGAPSGTRHATDTEDIWGIGRDPSQLQSGRRHASDTEGRQIGRNPWEPQSGRSPVASASCLQFLWALQHN